MKNLFILFLISYSTISCSSDLNESNIFLAKSVGIWSKDKSYGYFKVIVYRVGLEHARDKVRVLITKVNTKLNKQIIIKDIQLKSPSIKGYIHDLSLMVVNNQLSLGIDIEMKGMENIILRESYLINKDGVVKVIMPVKYVDIYE